MEIWNVYPLCIPPLRDIFFCVKNMTKMKYHADVIVSRRRDLALTDEVPGGSLVS